MMNCPNCGKQIDELTEICPKCKINLVEYDENNKEGNFIETGEVNKTSLLTGINVIQIIASIIAAIFFLANGQGITALIVIVVSVVAFAFIKGFSDIINLLSEINQTLKNNL